MPLSYLPVFYCLYLKLKFSFFHQSQDSFFYWKYNWNIRLQTTHWELFLTCPNKLSSHLEYLNMRKWVLTPLTFSNWKSLSEENQLEKNLRELAGTEASGKEEVQS